MKSKSKEEKQRQYGCNGQCYTNESMCPRAETCPETSVVEFLATALGCSIYLLLMLLTAGIMLGATIGIVIAAYCGVVEVIKWIWGLLFL